MYYTVKDLQKVSNTSLQSINKLFKSNSELRELVKEHKKVENRNVFYDEVIYEWFCRRYEKKIETLMENSEAGDNFENENQNIPLDTPPSCLPQEEETKQELERLKEKYAELQAEFEKVEAERKELLEQNGNLLLLLSQEKAEKQKLLPPPRKTIGERIRAFFHSPSAT